MIKILEIRCHTLCCHPYCTLLIKIKVLLPCYPKIFLDKYLTTSHIQKDREYYINVECVLGQMEYKDYIEHWVENKQTEQKYISKLEHADHLLKELAILDNMKSMSISNQDKG